MAIYTIEEATRLPNVGEHTPYEVKLRGAGWLFVENEDNAEFNQGDAVVVSLKAA